MITIDGSVGGGQLLRTALSLSAATGQAFEITHIRGQRTERGLKPQHLTAVHAMQRLCQARVEGDRLGSTSLRFEPGKVSGGHYRFDIGTAGSTTLVLQTLLPACLREEHASVFELVGGTDTTWCPPSLYFRDVFCDFLKRLGVHVEVKVERFGFYPRGGGKILAIVKQCKELKSISFVERGQQQRIHVAAYASRTLQSRQVIERMIKGFQDHFSSPVEVEQQYVDTFSPGCFLHCHAEYEHYVVGDDVLGEPKKRAEDVGEECAEKMIALMKGDGVDAYAADQLMIYMGLKGEGKVNVMTITDHVKTNAQVIEQFLPVQFNIENNTIHCRKI